MAGPGVEFPTNMDDMVVPPGVSGIDHAQLNEAFANLDTQIIALSRKVEAHRNYLKDSTPEKRSSSKCQMICKDLKGDKKLRCLRQCTRPVVPFEQIESMAEEFPIDVKRLQDDVDLRQNFERHQRAPETIGDAENETDAEASLIADMYAMPISTAALPDEAWARSMDLVKMDKFAPQRETLVRNWKYRAQSYSEAAKDELTRKINRHDTDDIILKTASRIQ